MFHQTLSNMVPGVILIGLSHGSFSNVSATQSGMALKRDTRLTNTSRTNDFVDFQMFLLILSLDTKANQFLY
jgi:hypothetical protein